MKHCHPEPFNPILAHIVFGVAFAALSAGAHAQMLQPTLPSPTQATTIGHAAISTEEANTGRTAKSGSGAISDRGGVEEVDGTAQKPGREGIKVHGHWVMVLRNSDGTVAGRREFDNSLVGVGQNTSGDQLLAALLSGNAVTGAPAIGLATGTIPSGDQSQLCTSNGYGVGCYFITTSASASPLFANAAGTTDEFVPSLLPIATGLSETVTFSPTVSWVLSGNFTVPANFNSNGFSVIAAVQTLVPICSPATGLSTLVGSTVYESIHGVYGGQTGDYAPKNCTGNVTNGSSLNENVFAASFTATNIPSPLTVAPGQVITVTVTITFS